MNFLNKNIRNKIIAQSLIGVSIFGLGCNLTINNPIQVNALSTTTIDEVSLLTDAQAKVKTAEETKLWRDINDASIAINKLPSGSDKDTLQSIIDKIAKEKTDSENKMFGATNAVIKAESSMLQSDEDSAMVLVNSLPENTEKTNLLSRLRYVQTFIDYKDAQSKLKIAESTKTQSNINIAQIAIDKLIADGAQTNFQSRLDALKTQVAKEAQVKLDLQEATIKVQIAEASVNLSTVKTYIANAQTVIDKLPDGTEKTALQERLNKMTTQISNNANKSLAMQAEPLVKFAVLFKSNKYKTQAWDIVNKMTPCAEKTAFVNKLNSIS